MTLRQRMAEFGFDSNDDYDFQLRALFEARLGHLRCLHVAGECGRRKTAFAHALAHALDYPHVVYHDFSVPDPPAPAVQLETVDPDKPQAIEAALTGFERVILECCAFSEAARVILILDQLQAAPFSDQARLYRFVSTGAWELPQGEVRANPKTLLLALVTEAPLYHPLAKASYRIWTDPASTRFDFRPQDYQLGEDARGLFDRLAALFEVLGSVPTATEFGNILADMLKLVRTEEQLRHTLYGWMERADRTMLYATAAIPALRAVVATLNDYLGLEEVEVGSEPVPDRS